MLTHEQIVEYINKFFPDATWKERLEVGEYITSLLSESKDIARFKGDISVFKQRAIDTAATLPRPATTRRKLERQAKKELNRVAKEFEARMLKLLRRYHSEDEREKLTRTRFIREMKDELRLAYMESYKLGTKASGLTTAADLGGHIGADELRWIENVLSKEGKYFNKFLKAIVAGESTKRSKIRIHNYAQAIKSVFEASKILQLPSESIIHWVLESHNPCPDCRLLHRLSPFVRETLPTTPKAGSTRCLSWCFCRLRIVKAKSGEVDRVMRRNKSAKHLLKKLEWNRKNVKS